MFTLLLGAFFEIVMIVGIAAFVYQVFLSDSIKQLISNRRESLNEKDRVNKIAKLILISDSFEEIEKFIKNNALSISNEMMKLLISRVEYLRADKIIQDDDRKRVPSLKRAPATNESVEKMFSNFSESLKVKK
jgi:hypothetical protein